MPFALVVIMMVLSVALYLIARLVFMRRHDALVTKHAGAVACRSAQWLASLDPCRLCSAS